MKALYVTGACLTKNTSANMSHNAFLSGLIENGFQVDVIMANDSWGESDDMLPKYGNADYHEYNAVSISEKIRRKSRTVIQPVVSSEPGSVSDSCGLSIKQKIRKKAKACFYWVVKPDPDYGKDLKWIKCARKFRSNTKYDLVVSNSSPTSSHKLVQLLIDKNHIYCERWVQIWEDPWYHDLYGGRPESTQKEEHFLLKSASEIYYVSPLTLMYQKQFFPDCADRMKCVPLPYLSIPNHSDIHNSAKNSFGYFGDYYAITRNLVPFYQALKQSGYKGFIYGDSDLSLEPTDDIEISERVTLDVLSKVQDKTDVLVHLSNLKGGQIPGKIYHYSATTKPILFILDGTAEEKNELRNFFGQYNRYYFCENTVESILETMHQIESEKKTFYSIEQFSPFNVVKQILK